MKNDKYYSGTEIKKIQRVELDILMVIIRICEENNITYFAMSGTLLGAIRHNGFIPWDDDMDICMPRKDYDKFIEICVNGGLNNPYKLMNYQTHKDCPSAYSKVCDTRTLLVEKECKGLKDYIHSVWVDIFPIDLCPDISEKELEKRKKLIMKKYQLFKSRILWTTSQISSKKNRILGSIFRPILHILLLPFSKDKLFNNLDRELRRYNDVEKLDNVLIMGGRIVYSKNSELFPLKKHKFEDIEVNIPNDSDTILKRLYGDYMTLPPIEKRVGHKPYKLVIDIE